MNGCRRRGRSAAFDSLEHLPGQAGDFSRELQIEQARRQLGGAHAGAGDERVEADRVEAEGGEHRVFPVGAPGRRGRARPGRRRRAGERELLSEWIEPGIANTSRPASRASRAVISEPERKAASTTSVPRARPAMMRFLIGKFSAREWVPIGNSLTIRPAAAMRCASARWPAG